MKLKGFGGTACRTVYLLCKIMELYCSLPLTCKAHNIRNTFMNSLVMSLFRIKNKSSSGSPC